MGQVAVRSPIINLDPALIRPARASLADEPGNLNALQRSVSVSGEPISKGWRAWDANTQQERDFA